MDLTRNTLKRVIFNNFKSQDLLIKEVRIIANSADPVFSIRMRGKSLRLVKGGNDTVLNSLHTSEPIKGRHVVSIIANLAFRMALGVFSTCLAAFNVGST